MTYSTGKLQLENDLWFPGVQRWHNSNSDLHVGFLAANLNRIVDSSSLQSTNGDLVPLCLSEHEDLLLM